jgi:Antitoxin-like ribbon-helix-helix
MASDAFVFTPEQKQLLASLSRETGKSIPALIAEALHLLCVKYGKPSLLQDTAFQITGTGTSV